MDQRETEIETCEKTFTVALIVLVLLCFREGESFADTYCKPSAIVSGPDDVVVEVRQMLADRGIAFNPQDGCMATNVRLRHKSSGIEVGIVDTYGRSSVRIVADIETVAALIESWTRFDLGAKLLEPHILPVKPAVPGAAIPRSSLKEPDPNVERANPSFAIDFLTSATLASDGSFWIDGNLFGCVFFGPICAGGMIKTAFDTGASGESSSKDSARIGLDVLLIADYPLGLGDVILTPGVGVGAGWLRSSGGTGSGEQQREAEIDAGGLRLNLSLRLLVPLSKRFSMEFGFFADYSPMAHTSPYLQDEVLVAGEPRWYLRGGLGIRYGGK